MLGRRTTTIITHDILYGQDPRARVMLSGMFRDEDIRAVNEARPDLCGFTVNWPSSRRHVDRDRLRRLVSLLDPTIPAVGVFFDQPLGFVSEVADEMLDVIQLQGTEGNAYMTFLRELADLPIIQAIRQAGQEALHPSGRPFGPYYTRRDGASEPLGHRHEHGPRDESCQGPAQDSRSRCCREVCQCVAHTRSQISWT